MLSPNLTPAERFALADRDRSITTAGAKFSDQWGQSEMKDSELFAESRLVTEADYVGLREGFTRIAAVKNGSSRLLPLSEGSAAEGDESCG